MSRQICICGGKSTCEYCFGRGYLEGGQAPVRRSTEKPGFYRYSKEDLRRIPVSEPLQKPSEATTIHSRSFEEILAERRISERLIAPDLNYSARHEDARQHAKSFTSCPGCGERVQNHDLDRHVWEKHHVPYAMEHPEDLPVVAEESRDESYGGTAIPYEPRQPNLDRTKNIGYVAREFGKYGTHPSHDGFDDESNS